METERQSRVSKLPLIMVAPTGARRTRRDHPALPVTIPEIVRTAVECDRAGAGAIHAHVRDNAGRHILDAGLCRELLGELKAAVPDMTVQITTEAVGIYTPEEQRDLVRNLGHGQVSIALREMISDQSENVLRAFYHWASEAGIAIQHILYSPREVRLFEQLVSKWIIPSENLELLFVLGQYAGKRDSRPGDIAPYLQGRRGAIAHAGWAVCAFGRFETDCLVQAVRSGGKARIGFENNLRNADGGMASSNAERVRELVASVGPYLTGDPALRMRSSRTGPGRCGPVRC